MNLHRLCIALAVLPLLWACGSEPDEGQAQETAEASAASVDRDLLVGTWLRPVRIEGEQEGWEGFELGASGEIELVGIYSMAADDWSVTGRQLTVTGNGSTQSYLATVGSDTLRLDGEGYLAGSYEREPVDSAVSTVLDESVGPQLEVTLSYAGEPPQEGQFLVMELNSPQHDAPLVTLRQSAVDTGSSVRIPYDAQLVHPEHDYLLSARLADGSNSALYSAPEVPVITQGHSEEATLVIGVQ